jgi:hypothetical protein
MPSTRSHLAYALAIVVGMSLWFWASLVSGRREAWDAAVYWTVAYPLAVGVAGMMGYVFPQRPWRWALTLFMAQFVAMAIRNGELGGMWPMGMILLALLSVPGMALGQFAAWLRGKRAEK